ncbi:ETC complex I subunit conserved region-domain-containing protein [Coniochaeta sp. 2T2.1]|nr:ETC complex I subunit conserved region-domain-containing protein [Coniochaeta sp. 2T2.1]
MRRTLFRLAAVKPARYLEPNTPTGITGLLTHGSPRAHLLYLYTTTLDKLKAVPEHSVYRKSVEALTKHRLSIVEQAVPPGYAEWSKRAQKLVADHPEQFNVSEEASGSVDGAAAARIERDGQVFIVRDVVTEVDIRDQEWDGERDTGLGPEGLAQQKDLGDTRQVKWEPEPQLTADQILELENKIGHGLIEEVVQVAEGELKLVDTMVKAKVWEDLEEAPAEGQWNYFERNSA